MIRLAEVFGGIRDPRSKQGTNLPLSGILAVVFPGLLAGQNDLAHIERWAKNHWRTLQKPLGFKRNHPPVDTTLSRNLANIPLQELQDAFAKFLSQLLENQELTAAVDGKTAKQIKDADSEPLLMLNVFVHDILETMKLTFDHKAKQVPAESMHVILRANIGRWKIVCI
ncbi:hypothetical protein FACS1894189_2620 [Planctomycetales bacterium]|nr:hypothetical protein FACS1894189_2620 [Planctomycetales bacterium]